jgi:hypothetical protein
LPLKLLLLTPKPPRLSRIKMRMELKDIWRRVNPLCHHPQLNLRTKVQKRRGNA